MRRVLIITPYFPPSNAADMQRIRMSLPYFKEMEWDAEVVTVDPDHSDLPKDYLLLKSIPPAIKIHQVQAFSKKWTSKIGLGSIALRAMLFYRRYVDQLLKEQRFDLIYFSTTQFPLCILGSYWKKKFGVPYVIDMQDPWHSEYYQDKPASQRPKKYWFSYRMHRYLEPLAMKDAGGIISVSEAYISTLRQRYPVLQGRPASVITFAGAVLDFDLAASQKGDLIPAFQKQKGRTELVYVGRGGYDMKKAVTCLFEGIQCYLNLFPAARESIHFHFIGTSYAPEARAVQTIAPLAAKFGLESVVSEQTARIGYYETIRTLQDADGLLLIGSDDSQYTASKLYPYILARKPLLAILHPESNACTILKDCKAGDLITLDETPENAAASVVNFIKNLSIPSTHQTDMKAFEEYSAREMTKKQVDLFEEVLDGTI